MAEAPDPSTPSPKYQPQWRGRRPGRVQRGNYWEVWSPKLRRRVRLNSDLEYYHWLVCLEGDPDVETFCEEPARVIGSVEGEEVTTVLDAWLRRRCGREQMREVKYQSEVDRAERGTPVWRQREAQRGWCRLQAIEHEVVTERSILAHPVLVENWTTMLGYLRADANRLAPDGVLADRIAAVLARAGAAGIPLREAELALADAAPATAVRRALFGLYHRGQVRAVEDLRFERLVVGTRFRLA